MMEEEEEVEEATDLAFIRDAHVTVCRVFGSCTVQQQELVQQTHQTLSRH
jgi:hypothetical protein